ncbi:hypothetical protein GCM10010168_09310 [Actinoplanes ianthinogenes]|uniref:Lipoprotein n=1 Tax=Actinoplanes ianthinogenes TaxID=122358 RepID=A0ABN6CIS1_9ACTN|nr:hypothetical protein [Actinoplanes ianthinogenes]BCJ44118.1 hypothetical protein Aiant_47750 [Actinoplanes ianthinogenes]GGQ95910.1 hypothetical protein GCM10010168_09310 [Actinoplanes ianthinogenes]
MTFVKRGRIPGTDRGFPVRLLAAVAGVTVLLSLSGCGGDKADAQPVPDSNLPSFMAQQTEKEPKQADVDDYYVKFNDIMKTCMKEQGFDYRDYIPTTDKKMSLGLTDEQFARQYGYGISTLIDYLAPGSQRVDPNINAVQKLDKAARASYGKQSNECQQRAQDKIGPPPSGGAIKMSTKDQQAMDGVVAKTNTDQRVKAAQADRSTCLEGKGFTAGEDLTQPISAAADKYIVKFENKAGEMEAAGRNSDKLKITDVLTADEMADLKKIQKREIAMAVETSPCQSAYDKAYKKVFNEYLQKLLRGEK